MRTLLLTSGFYGLLLITGFNAAAKPIDQGTYLSSPVPAIEKRQHSWPDGRLYDGQWLQDQPHGQGMLTYPDGGQYWGRFQMGKRQGEGLMKFVNGDEYEGEWFKDQPHGKGVMRFADGARHEGQFEQGQPSGQGRRTYPDGSVYDGQWLQSVPHGFGRLSFPSGETYEGQFRQGKPHGRGIYYFANGDLYEGEWNNGLQEGKGRFDYATGGFYEGSVIRGKRQGRGIWVSALGQRYEGQFVNNQPHGDGRCGTLSKMEPCSYRNGKRIEQVRPAPTPMVVASLTAPVPTVAAAVVSDAVQKVPMASAAPDTLAVSQEELVQQSAPIAEGEAQPAPHPSAAAQSRSATFTQTLEQKKQQLKKTLADLHPSRSDIWFNEHGTTTLGLLDKPGRAGWKKTTSLLRNQLEIRSHHGHVHLHMVIDNYRGPGRYTLSRVRIEGPGTAFDIDGDGVNQIFIESEEDGWISGQFEFNVRADSGHTLDIRDGVFRISEGSPRLSFLR